MSMPGYRIEEYVGNTVLIGYHAASSKAQDYAACDFLIDDIEQWLSHSPFRPSERVEDRLVFNVYRREDEVLAQTDEFRISIRSRVSTVRDIESQITIKSPCFIHIEASEPQALDWFLSNARKIQELASLCAGRMLPLSSLRLYGPEEKVLEDYSKRPEADVLVELTSNDPPKNKSRDPYPFTARQLVEHSPGAITAWINAYEHIAPTLYLYFAVISGGQMFSDIRFVLATQALEAYHRALSPGGLVDKETYDEIIEAMILAIPVTAEKALRDKLERTLEYSNEATLGQRMRALIKPLRQEFGKSPVGISDGYITRIVDTRNYKTHHSESGKRSAFESGEQLHWATRRLVTLITLLLIQHIGVPQPQIHKAMSQNREFDLLFKSKDVPPLG